MKTKTIAKLAKKNSQTLAHFNNIWRGNPVLDILEYRRLAFVAWMWSLTSAVFMATFLICVVGKPFTHWQIVLGAVLFLPVGRLLFGLGQGCGEKPARLSKNAESFLEAIKIVERQACSNMKGFARSNLLFSECDRPTNLWYKLARSYSSYNDLAKNADYVLHEAGRQIAGLQMITWKKTEAQELRRMMEDVHSLISGILPINKNLGSFFPGNSAYSQ